METTADSFDLNIGKPSSYHLSCQSDKSKPEKPIPLLCGVVFYSQNGEPSYQGKYKVSKGYIFIKDPSTACPSKTTGLCGGILELLMEPIGTEGVEFSEFAILNGKLRHLGSKSLKEEDKKHLFVKEKPMTGKELSYLKSALGLTSGFIGLQNVCQVKEPSFKRVSEQNVQT